MSKRSGTTRRGFLRSSIGAAGAAVVTTNDSGCAKGLATESAPSAPIAPEHDRTFRARFPSLRGVEMEYRWSGRLCLSRNDAWALGELRPGLYSACCQNGLGLSRGTLSGILVAEQASGQKADSLVTDYRPGPPPSRLFPEPFMTLGARSVIRFQEKSAGREL